MMIKDHLFKNVDSFSLGLFRCLFGALMIVEMLMFYSSGTFLNLLTKPLFHFSYDYFEFISPAGEFVINTIHFVLVIAAICIMIGYYSRWASLVFFILFTYFLLCCRGHYNNHYYLISLLSFLLVFADADRSFSIRKKNQLREKIIPIWQINALRIQLFVVYFFGGIAKLNPDWLVLKEPLRSTFNYWSPNGFLSSEFAISFFTYGGLIFDLFIGFFLLIKKTRRFAIIGLILFNVMNGILFDNIEIFPYLVIAYMVIFLDPEGDTIKRIKSIFAPSKTQKSSSSLASFVPRNKLVIYGLGLYFAFQFLFPLRHHLLTENVIWTGIAGNFAWHMKVQNRGGEEISFLLVEGESGQKLTLDYQMINSKISNGQIAKMTKTPVMAWQFANWIGAHLNEELRRTNKKQLKDIQVYCKIKTSFNGRKPQYIIDPTIDLTKVTYSPFKENTWILPLKTEW